LLAGPHPPRARDDHEEAVVRMEVGPAHVPGEPLDPRDVGPGLARVAEQHGLLVGAGRVLDPPDVGRRREVHRGAVDVGAVAGRRGGHASEQGERERSSPEGHAASSWAACARAYTSGATKIPAPRPAAMASWTA